MGNVQMEASMIRYGSGTVKSALDNGGGGGGSSTLAGLTDTDISTPSNGQVLAYDSTAEKWENASLSTPSLSDLTDTTISTPTNGQVLTYDSTAERWVNASAGGGGGTSYTLTDVPEKELTGTSYEDMADVVLNPGVYHIIASAMNTVTSVVVTGIRFADGATTLVESTVTGNVKSIDMIYAVESQTTIKVQAKGSANCKNVKSWVMVAKVGDVTPPAQNNR